MRIAIPLYDRMTALDAIGPYEVLARIPGAEVVFVGHAAGEVRADQRLGLTADAVLEDVPAPEVVLVPGGPGQADLMGDERLLSWLRRTHETTTWTTSVCTGSLLLAAAGVLEGRRATSHWLALEALRRFGAEPVQERWVEDGKIITAAGVSAGIDMALELASRLAGPQVAQGIQLGIEHDPQPPFDAGSPSKAPDDVVAFLRANSRFVLEGRPTT
ncbi:MAG TPA: DJ-1/PfpI family protein [Egibacteraceae bacterium]|nr:DJ-1/PfpI family protein [Egibacteraceae bacterium]